VGYIRRSTLIALRSTAAIVVLAFSACSGDNGTDPSVPTTIVATTSTTLTGAASSAVSPAPSVLVTDQNGAPVAGVTVEFVVQSGGGSVSGGSVPTDAAGIATVGSWTLGPNAGANTLSATAGSLAPVIFTATGTVVTPPPPPSACEGRTVHSLGTTTTGSLATTDCQLVDNTFVTFVDFFSTTLGEASAYLFRQSASFDTYLFLATPDLAVIAENDDETPTSTNSAIKALLPAGSYLLGASSFDAKVTGDYSISSTTASTTVTGCERVFVVKKMTTTQSIEPADCLRSTPPAAPVYADAYLIFLRAGQSMTVSMSSIQVDASLEVVQVEDLVQLNGPVVASNDNRDGTTKDSELSYTAVTSAYYRIIARTAVTSQTGVYTLNIQ
jgi:hypothetical protein